MITIEENMEGRPRNWFIFHQNSITIEEKWTGGHIDEIDEREMEKHIENKNKNERERERERVEETEK